MLSLSTLGYVCGLESLSSPTAVISFPESESYAPLIQATFVNILSLSVSGLAVTSHVNSNVSLSKELVVYAFNDLDVVDLNVNLFVLSVYVTLYVFLFEVIVEPPVYFSPVGNWSVISVAYPFLSPSLYIVILYVTISPFFTATGSFLWLYVAVVPVCNVVSEILGTLEFVTLVPFNFVIYLRNAKSNSFGIAVNCTLSVCVCSSTSSTGCSESSVTEVVPFSVPTNHIFLVLVV